MHTDIDTLQTKKTTPATRLRNYISARPVDSHATSYLPVTNPATGAEIASVPLGAARDVDDAVRAARTAFPSWSATPIKERAQVFFRYKALMEKHMKELAELVHTENGKVMTEAAAEVEKAVEVTEFACAMP